MGNGGEPPHSQGSGFAGFAVREHTSAPFATRGLSRTTRTTIPGASGTMDWPILTDCAQADDALSAAIATASIRMFPSDELSSLPVSILQGPLRPQGRSPARRQE